MAGEIQLNSVSLATESGGTVTLNSSTDIKGCLNASGSAPVYACRAWINFDGTSASIGTGRENGNVSGVTDNGIGEYAVNFATDMPDANYCVNTMAKRPSTDTTNEIYGYGNKDVSFSTSSFTLHFRSVVNNGLKDPEVVCISVFR